ncbi:RusA family crossover junction endodeoxyribonuclease [Paucidesulfovibrio longus]|uniref:RusA family crossover junction endodeoxyribonuclease n=1 Tax=Paucidesulfovibrio longus TaxID=889 RepID=UPI0009DBD9A8|nr:RusA family crossover junction endodeoxyribonuclease [Paucidesulfovibrio longus]
MKTEDYTNAEIQDWKMRIAGSASDNYGHFPPTKSRIDLTGPTPVSFQGGGTKKALIKEMLQAQTIEIPWIWVEDVEVQIEWRINDLERYEYPKTPDLDNILKPIIDALCGPNGIIIDDCQIVSITATCLGGFVEGYNGFDVSLFFPDIYFQNNRYILKNNLEFVDIGQGLFVPIDRLSSQNNEYIKKFLVWANSRHANRDEGSMMLNRFYHKSRVMDFKQVPAHNYL